MQIKSDINRALSSTEDQLIQCNCPFIHVGTSDVILSPVCVIKEQFSDDRTIAAIVPLVR